MSKSKKDIMTAASDGDHAKYEYANPFDAVLMILEKNGEKMTQEELSDIIFAAVDNMRKSPADVIYSLIQNLENVKDLVKVQSAITEHDTVVNDSDVAYKIWSVVTKMFQSCFEPTDLLNKTLNLAKATYKELYESSW